MKPFKHQEEISLSAYGILKRYGLVYLAMEERTGKTLTSILTCEMSICKNILVITKKKAIKGDNDKNTLVAKEGWAGTFNNYFKVDNVNNVWDTGTKKYTLVNYEMLKNIKGNYDLIILDEAHSKLSTYPKPSITWATVLKFTKNKPIIYLSATPSAQSYSQLYHQLALSSYSPWKQHLTFYQWFSVYGIPEFAYVNGGKQITIYDKTREELIDKIKENLFISYTRKQLGFKVEPKDSKVYIEPTNYTKKLYSKLLKNKVIPKDYFIEEVEDDYIADVVIRLRTGLHQIEGGTLKINNSTSILLGNLEKVNYIKNTYGDVKDLVIMYNFVKEKELLEEHFKNATILQGTSYAEGVDLSMYSNLIVYSMDYSTSKYSQRRARQANIKREKEIKVVYLLMKNAVSEQVYDTVIENKTNFIDKYFKQLEI